MKTIVDKSDIYELVLVSVDLSKLSDVIKYVFGKNDVYKAKIKNIEDQIPDVANVATNASGNAKTNEVKGEIPNNTKLATTTALIAVENNYLMLIIWSKKLTTIQKLMKLKRVLLIMIMINILLVQFIELLTGLGNGLIIQSTFC